MRYISLFQSSHVYNFFSEYTFNAHGKLSYCEDVKCLFTLGMKKVTLILMAIIIITNI